MSPHARTWTLLTGMHHPRAGAQPLPHHSERSLAHGARGAPYPRMRVTGCFSEGCAARTMPLQLNTCSLSAFPQPTAWGAYERSTHRGHLTSARSSVTRMASTPRRVAFFSLPAQRKEPKERAALPLRRPRSTGCGTGGARTRCAQTVCPFFPVPHPADRLSAKGLFFSPDTRPAPNRPPGGAGLPPRDGKS